MSAVPENRFWRTPFDVAEVRYVRGDVNILEDRCKGCAYCVEFCPCGVLSRSERFNLKGYHPPDVTSPDLCVACRLCEIICPEFAIGVGEQTQPEVSHAR